MGRATKRKTAFLILAAWALLFAFSFSERLGYCHDTDEYACQSVEQALSSPVEAAPNNSIHILNAFTAISFGAVSNLAAEIAAPPLLSFHAARIFDDPPLRHQKIFQYTSAYLI